MNILHVFSQNNLAVTKSYIKFINENYDKNHHNFLFLGKPNRNSNEFQLQDNIEFFQDCPIGWKKFLHKVKVSDKILFHSSLGIKFQLFYLIFNKFSEQIYWVSWGGDMYEIGTKGKGIRKHIKKYIALSFAKKIKYFVGIFPPDIEYFNRELNSNAKTFHASYVDSINSPLYQDKINYKSLREKASNNECINVQVGHSSSQILNHLEVLNSLEKFKNENIKIFIPLSYGDKLYGDLVENEANKIFGDKAICLREMVDKESYYKFLSSIDIAIFNSKRQIGLGNINPLLFMEKKIFIPEGSVMYDFYNSKNIDIWNYNDVVDMDYYEFIKPLNGNNGRNFIIENELDLGKKIEMWNKVFEAPLK